MYKNGVIALRNDWEEQLEEKYPGYKEKYIGPVFRKIMPKPCRSGISYDKNIDYVCHTCHSYMIKGKMAPMSNQNNLQLVDKSKYPELDLKEVETNLVARNLLFQKIRLLPKSRWKAMIDRTVNVPIPEEDISYNLQQLPRTPMNAHIIPVKLKRAKRLKNVHRQEFIDCKKIIQCIETMKNLKNPFYKDTVTNLEEYLNRCKELDDNFTFSSENQNLNYQ